MTTPATGAMTVTGDVTASSMYFQIPFSFFLIGFAPIRPHSFKGSLGIIKQYI
jgi:hypothetical protein